MTILPYISNCLENRSPEVKANLFEIGCALILNYFPYIDLENQ